MLLWKVDLNCSFMWHIPTNSMAALASRSTSLGTRGLTGYKGTKPSLKFYEVKQEAPENPSTLES